MKKRIKHLSKSTVSVILTLCMLVSCVTVGLIATDAAQLTGENRVGAAASEDSEVGASSGDKVGASVDEESVGVNTYFTKGETIFIHAADIENSAYKDSAVVKAWFKNSSSAPVTAKVGGINDNYYYAVVDAATYTEVQIQRFRSDGTSWLNSNGDVKQDDRSNDSYNVIQTIRSDDSGASWENATYSFSVSGDITANLADSGEGIFSCTTSVTAAKTSYSFQITGSDATTYVSNGIISDLAVGQTYNVKITYNITNNTYTAGITYPVTVKCGSHGKFTVANNTADQTLNAGSATGTTLPAMTADSGYRFVNWTVNDSSKVAVTNETSNGTAAVTATATGGIVTANFEAIGDTTIYVFKSTSVQKIYLWDTVGNISKAWPGDSFEPNTSPTGDFDYKEYNFGGAAYYKYTFPYTPGSPNVFSCVINKSGDKKKTANIENLEKGHTYYIGWSGANTNEPPIYCTKNNYPYYYLNYKVKDTDDSTLQKVSFTYGYYDLSVQRGIYQFCITREWNATQDQRFGTGSFTRTSGQQYTKLDMASDVSSYSELDADVNGSYRMYLDAINTSEVSTTIFFPTIDNYNVIGAYENNGNFFDDVTAWTLDTSKNVLTGSVTKTLTVASPKAGTYYYKAVIKAETPSDILGGASPSYYYTYFPSPLDSPSTGCKEIEIAADCTSLTFTFNSSTGAITAKAKYPTDWPPSDIETTYTNDSAMNIVYANNDDFADNEGNFASHKTGVKQNSGGTAYWYDLTDLVLSDNSAWSNFYFCLSNATDKSGILGTGTNSVTDSNDTSNTKNNGEAIRLPKDDTKTLLLNVQSQEKNTTARFPGLHSINRDKLVHLGVVITDTSGTLDYKFYYQEDAKVSTGPKLVKIYAKNGELRDSTYNRFTLLADTQLPDAEIRLPSGYTPASDKEVSVVHNKAYGNSNYDYAVNVPVGSTITISTQLTTERADNDYGDTFANTHYLKAYSMNGKTYQIFTPNDTGLYTQTWTIPEDWADDYIEITPIYYLKDSSLTKTFYIEKYAGSVQNKWGNLLSVYPYYEGKDNKANAFGGYPGQPMLYWGGKYQMEIPLTVDGTSGGAPVKGLTIHNSYWDLLHRSLDAKCKDHCQTYDYDDFYVLCKEKNPDTIYFTFEYHSQHDNYADGYEYKTYDFVTSKEDSVIQSDARTKTTIAKIEGANGAEIVTDYYGRQVDIFGNLLNTNARSTYSSGADSLKGNELLIVSDGYKDTYVGEYATIWAVYKQDEGVTKGNFTFLGYISSSMLYLNSLDNVKNYANGTSTSAGRMSDPNFTATYNALQAYKGKPVLISYEEEIRNKTKDKAYRSDGKWYYSAGSDKICANIKIQYANSTAVPAIDDDSWTDECSYVAGYLGKNNTGAYTGCSAYFTNTVPNIIGKQSSGDVLVDNSKFFTFKANAAGKWVFAGWVRQNSDGKYDEIESTEGLGQSNISANETYIARFVKATAGTLLASHTIEQTATYTGTGTPSITATLVESDGTTAVSGSSAITVRNGSDINLSSWMTTANATRGYKIKFELVTTPATDCAWVETLSKTNGYAVTSSATTSATYAISDIADMGTTAIRFVSHLSKAQITYAYEITYYYESRFWGEQFYKVTGTVPELLEDTYFTGNKTTATLNTDFIKSQTPFEKNFRQKINWNYEAADITVGSKTVAGMTNIVAGEAVNGIYTMRATVHACSVVDDKAYAEFKLPYAFNRSGDMTATKSTTFASDENTESNGSEIVFDEGDFASKTVESQFYKLFAYNNSHPAGGENVSMTSANLVQAAPYVWKGATKHYTREYGTRTMSGTLDETDLAGYVKAGTSPVPAEAGTTYTYYDADGTSQTATSVIYYKGYQSENDYESKINYFEHLASYDLTTPYQKQDGYVLGKNAQQYYFSGWKVYTTDMEYVATSYQPYFNLSAYDNYIVIPQYDFTTPVIPESNTTSATITYLGDTRNQWTSGGQGNYNTVTHYDDGVYGADKLITDFGIAYDYNGQKLYNLPKQSAGGADVTVGVVFERLNELEDVAGVKQTSGAYYSEKYSSSYIIEGNKPDDKSLLRNYINQKIAGKPYSEKNSTVNGRNFYQLGANTGESSTMANAVDNFNRLQYYHTITKSSNNALGVSVLTGRENFTYRAIAFIKVNETLTLSDPVYFTIYDTATRTGN